LKTDPRADPRFVAACAPFALDGAPPPIPVHAGSPWQAKLDYVAASETGMEGVFAALFTDLPPISNVERRTEVIKGVDGNDIHLYIHNDLERKSPNMSRRKEEETKDLFRYSSESGSVVLYRI